MSGCVPADCQSNATEQLLLSVMSANFAEKQKATLPQPIVR
jgi:hypothetical protein